MNVALHALLPPNPEALMSQEVLLKTENRIIGDWNLDCEEIMYYNEDMSLVFARKQLTGNDGVSIFLSRWVQRNVAEKF